MDDAERHELMQRLDEDLDAFIQEKIDNKQERDAEKAEEEPVDIEALAAELRDHPAFMTEFDPSKPLSPAMEGLQQLKYMSDSPDTNAESYKEDGNRNFKIKKYRWAIDNYTAGIKCKPQNKDLNAILYSNRAASQFHLGNFRSAFNDSIAARKFKPDHMKALVRSIQCCIELKRFKDAIKFCDDGLLLSPKDEKFLSLRSQTDKAMRQQERDRRRAEVNKRQVKLVEKRLLQCVEARGIRIAGVPCNHEGPVLSLDQLETHHPSGARVHQDDGGALHWPVMFLYPEYTETDFIQNFHEESRFASHIDDMFGNQAEQAPWDEEHKYTPDRILICFEDRDTETLIDVEPLSTLGSVLKDKRYQVQGGTPSFIIIVRDSAFAKHFLAKYGR